MSARTYFLAAVAALSLVAVSNAQGSNWFEVRGGAWDPNPETASQLQAAFPSEIERLAGKRVGDFQPWPEYRFQFQGQERGSEHFIFVSALCSVDDAWDLTERFIVVFDGGACYFQVKYDPNTHQFYDLVINGVA
jgi:hypothetical protein